MNAPPDADLQTRTATPWLTSHCRRTSIHRGRWVHKHRDEGRRGHEVGPSPHAYTKDRNAFRCWQKSTGQPRPRAELASEASAARMMIHESIAAVEELTAG